MTEIRIRYFENERLNKLIKDALEDGSFERVEYDAVTSEYVLTIKETEGAR